LVDGIGKRWTNFYSAAGRLVATADPLGHITTTYALDGK
jgi:YD repeat-containing protein